MKILLAEAPFSYAHSYVKGGERFLPLGIAYIAAVLKKELPALEVRTFVDGMDDFAGVLRAFGPDVIGLSAMTTTYPAAAEMARLAKAALPASYVVIGGQHVSGVGARVLEEVKDADFLCVGEGERFLVRLLNEITAEAHDWASIPGIVFRQDSKIITVAPALPEPDLDAVPFPARELFDLSRFKSHDFMRFGSKTVSMISSRGCTARCTFCSSFATMGRQYRFRSAENVVAELEHLVQSYGIDGVIFWDDAFTFKKERVVRFCELLKEKRLALKWWCMSRVDAIDASLAELMADSGCVMISFGLESGSQETLKRIKKGVRLEAALAAIKNCNKAGIRTQGTFMLGLPFETRADIDKTIDFALGSCLDMAIFFSFTPFPGTEQWQYVDARTKPVTVEDWHKYVCNTNISKSWNPDFSDQELKELVISSHRRFYLRFSQMFRIMKTIRSGKEFAYYAKGGLELAKLLLLKKNKAG